VRAFYSDVEPYVCDWLRELIAWRYVTDGVVDERGIGELKPVDFDGFSRCHFFAGLGGWDYALQLAGWPNDAEVWTGSCPCQPFSVAGKKKGTDDARHLWPVWLGLIAERMPATICGEQVAGPLGRSWLAGVQADLEALGYRFAAADLCAAGVGAPHIRQRLWWVADTEEGRRREIDPNACWRAQGSGAEGRERSEHGGGAWRNTEDIPCADGKARPIEPGLEPLADGIPGRVGRLRAYGNAIVPQVAAQFVAAYMEANDGGTQAEEYRVW